MITASSAFSTANQELAKNPIYLIEITGYSKKFTNVDTGISGQHDWLTSIEDLSINVSDMDGGADLGSLQFSVQDVDGAITADFPDFTFEGKQITLKTGFAGMSQADFVTLFTGFVTNVDSANANLEYQFSCGDQSQLLAALIYTTGDDGQPTDSDHLKTVIAHPLDILVDVLNQVGMPSVDTTKIEAYRDGIFTGLEFSFVIDSPPTAKDFIEQQLLKPLGGYLFTNNAGQASVNFFYQEDRDADMSLDDDVIIDDPVPEQADLVNQVHFKFDKSDSDYLSDSVQLFTDSIALYGLYGEQEFESDGMRSGLGGFFLASFIARIIFLRYGLKTLRLPSVELFWTACVLEPGDLVAVTNPTIPDRKAGVVGISGKKFEVLDRTWRFADGVVELTLIDSSYLAGFGTTLIAPDGTGDYASETSTNKAKYMFLTNDLGKYSNGDNGHGLA